MSDDPDIRRLFDPLVGAPVRPVDVRAIRRRGRRRVLLATSGTLSLVLLAAGALTNLPERPPSVVLAGPEVTEASPAGEARDETPGDGQDSAPEPPAETTEALTADPPPQPQPPPPEPGPEPEPEPAPGPTPYDRIVALPSVSGPEGTANALHDVLLRGDPDLDGGCLWVEIEWGAPGQWERFDTKWPAGWQARFYRTADGDEGIELLDADGNLVARAGQLISVEGFYTLEGELDRCHVGTTGRMAHVPAVGDGTWSQPPRDP